VNRFGPSVPIQNVSLFRAMMKDASIYKYHPMCNTKISILLSHCVRVIWYIQKEFHLINCHKENRKGK